MIANLCGFRFLFSCSHMSLAVSASRAEKDFEIYNKIFNSEMSTQKCRLTMSTQKAPGSARVSLKSLAKFLNRFCPVTVDDISNPKPEATMDILWNICCHIHGEEYLLERLRGKEKRIGFTIILRSLFDKCIPSQADGFTLTDMVYPTKDRMVHFYIALMKLIKVYDAQMHAKESVHAEIAKIKTRKQLIQDNIVRTTERVHIAEEKKEQTDKRCAELKDKVLTLDRKCRQKTVEMGDYHSQTGIAKAVRAELQMKKAEIRKDIKAEEDKICYLELNALPPKAEFEEKLRSLKSEAEQKEEERVRYLESIAALNDKMKSNAKNKTVTVNAHALLTEIVQVRDKNREKMADCRETITTLEKSTRDIKLLIKETQWEMTLHTQTVKAEKNHLEARIADTKDGISQLQIVEDDLNDSLSARTEHIERLAQLMKELKVTEQQVNDQYEKMLEFEKKAIRQLDVLYG